MLECDAGREAALNKVVEGLQELVCYQHARADSLPLHTYLKNICHTPAETENMNPNTEYSSVTVLGYWEFYFKIFTNITEQQFIKATLFHY